MISFQTNIDSLIAQQNLNINSQFQSQTIQQLTSGYRINSSGDDAAGLAVANQDRDQIAQITQGVANGNDGTALLQTMDGGMSNISQILDRLQTLAAQSASSSFTGSRADLNAEFQTDIGELNRQAQAIGLNTGGTYAQTMDVYLGGGGGANAAAISQNGQVSVDLSKSTVDAHSLGLAGMGMQVVAGTADLSSNSTTHSAYDIVTNAANKAAINNGPTTFYISGPGFSDGGKAALSVSLSGVSDINTLVTAINNAITTASGGATPAAAALKTAGITASVTTNADGTQQLAFSSNTTAFQVEAGDQMANALMGNLAAPNTSAAGTAIQSTVTGATLTTPTTTNFASAYTGSNVSVQISGAGLATPTVITLNTASDTHVSDAITDLKNQIASLHPELAAAGITLSQSGTGPLTFTSATGENFSVQVTGDTNNLLGLGALDDASTATAPGAFYSTITGGDYSANTGNGLATLGFSLNGGPTDGGVTVANPTEKAASFTGSGITLSTGAFNTQNLGTLAMSVNGTAFSINFANDANNYATTNVANESLVNVVKYINSQVNSQMGWGSDVQLATITSGNKITFTDPYADSNSTLAITGGTALGALGLSAQSATGTDAVGNTVTVNLAGGDATSASYTSQATAGAMKNGINTAAGPASVSFTIDNQAVTANFANDVNKAGNAAVLTGTTLGTGPASTVDTGALQATGGQLVGTALGAAATVDTAALLAQGAVFTGNQLGGSSATVNTYALLAQKATITGTGVATPGSVTLTGDLSINGHTITLSNDTESLTAVAADIASASATTGVTASATTVDGVGYLKLQSLNAGTGSNTTISVTDTADAEALGLTVSGQSSPTTAAGTAAQTLGITIGTGAEQHIDFTNDANALSGGESQTNILHFLNGYNGQAAALTGATASFTAQGALVITSTATGAGTAAHITIDNGANYTAAAQALGLATAGQTTGLTAQGKAAQELGITVGTNAEQHIDFTNDTNVSGTETQAQILSFLNGGNGLTGATAAFTSTGALTITNNTTGSTTAAQISVDNGATYGTAAQTLGLTTAGQTTSITAQGTAAKTLSLNIDGLGAVTVDFTGDTNINATTGMESLTNIAARINTAIAALGGGATYAAYTTPVQVVNGALQITGLVKGSAAGSVSVGAGTAALTLGLNSSATGAANAVTGTNESVQQVVNFLNLSAQQALGTSTSAQIFSLAGSTVSVASQTTGLQSGIAAGADSGGVLAGLGITASSTLATGKAQTLASVASTLTQAFKANTSLNEAGLVATASGNDLQIASSSNNNTSFRLAEYDTASTGGSDKTTLGFTSTPGPFSQVLNSGVSNATLMDAGGTSAIGNGTTTSPYLAFNPLVYGSDAQSITFTANNAAGVQQPLTLTLRNDTGGEAGATSGASIDSAVAYINSKLQASDNTTLQSIVAVKENVKGVEQINFLSSLSSFSVSVGSSVNGNGLNGGVAQTFGSVSNGAANNSAIDTLAGAQAAVTSVTAAVGLLGTAQAAVGKGENQLNYAINLAQSQITNISAAESQIRDANVAMEAANLTKAQVLQQSTVAAMAQANQEPQAVLSLLKQ